MLYTLLVISVFVSICSLSIFSLNFGSLLQMFLPNLISLAFFYLPSLPLHIFFALSLSKE